MHLPGCKITAPRPGEAQGKIGGFEMSKSLDNDSKNQLTVKVNPTVLEFVSTQISDLEALAGKVAKEASTMMKLVRELREQFESTRVLIGDVMKGGKNEQPRP